MKTVTSFRTLMQLAATLGKAKVSKDEKEIKKAQKEFDSYKQVCLDSDEMTLHTTVGNLIK